jgi:ubiquinone/menaquinone biosynthesis C-methylase UbiE
MKSISGTGISALELACNDQFKPAGYFKQADLNVKPALPYPDRSFDMVTCVVSFDYLTKPLQVA